MHNWRPLTKTNDGFKTSYGESISNIEQDTEQYPAYESDGPIMYMFFVDGDGKRSTYFYNPPNSLSLRVKFKNKEDYEDAEKLLKELNLKNADSGGSYMTHIVQLTIQKGQDPTPLQKLYDYACKIGKPPAVVCNQFEKNFKFTPASVNATAAVTTTTVTTTDLPQVKTKIESRTLPTIVSSKAIPSSQSVIKAKPDKPAKPSIKLTKDAQKVETRVKEQAKNIGNKAANLIELQPLCRESGLTNVEVPTFLPLTTQQIFQHLEKHAPTWQKLWDEFVQAQKQGQNKTDIAPAARLLLIEIRKLIHTTFQKHPIDFKEASEYIEKLKRSDPTALLAVRSTSREDTAEFANPGGNETALAVSPDLKSISTAMTEVVMSYFSEKSLKQRLLANNDITEVPFVPVLLQKMVGNLPKEKLATPLKSADFHDIMRAGVIYTTKDTVRFETAPGLGELVANSKGFTDKYFVTRENVVHSEIYRKNYCCVPSRPDEFARTSERTKLVALPSSLKQRPSIPQHIAVKIAQVGRLIDKHYGRPMDVEFVYQPNTLDPTQDKLYIVQARPREMMLEPSAIPPVKLPQLQQIAGASLETASITSAGNALKVITAPEEILIRRDINAAHSDYIGQENSKVKVVIVQEPVGNEFSHEAGMFNRQEIPVLQIDNIQMVQNWVLEKNPVVVVDVQNRIILLMTDKVENPANAEADLRAAGFIRDKLYVSSMNPRETILPSFDKMKKAPVKLEEFDAKTKLEQPLNQTQKLGDLLLQVNSDDSKIRNQAFNLLMQQLYTMVAGASWKKTSTEKVYSQMKTNLQVLLKAQPGMSNKETELALRNLLIAFTRLAKSTAGKKLDAPHKRLFKQAFITCAEIYKYLNLMSTVTATDTNTAATTATAKSDTKEDLEQPHSEYLDLISRLKALVTNMGTKELISDSVLQLGTARNTLKDALKIPGSEKLSPKQQEYFAEIIKLQNLALNDNTKTAWKEFALACCQEGTTTLRLAKIVRFLVHQEIAEEWLNDHFLTLMNGAKKTGAITPAAVDKVLVSLEKEMTEISKSLTELQLEKKLAIIRAWETRFSEWADPNKFEVLWKQYQAEVLSLIQQLDVDPKQHPLVRNRILNTVLDLTEMMDKTIKSITDSAQYHRFNPKEQVERFAILLNPFHELMKKWVNTVPDAQLNQWRFRTATEKTEMLQEINKSFEELKRNLGPHQLKPSTQISVEAAGIDSAINFNTAFIQKREMATLETLFSLMHHNIKATVSTHLPSLQAINLPLSIQPLYTICEALPFMSRAKCHYSVPLLTLDYNIPQPVHSLKCSIQYDTKQNNCRIKFYLFGNGTGGRWRNIQALAALDSLVLNGKLTPDPNLLKYPEKDDVTFTLEIDPKILSAHGKYFQNLFTSYRDLSFVTDALMTQHTKSFFSRTNIVSESQAREFIKKLIKHNAEYQPPIFENMGFLAEFVRYFDKYSEGKEINEILTKIVADHPDLLIEGFTTNDSSARLDPAFADLLLTKYKANAEFANLKKPILEKVIFNALWVGNLEPLSKLIQYGIKVDYQDPITRETYLHKLVLKEISATTDTIGKSWGRPFAVKIMKLLIENGADLNATNAQGKSPLDLLKNAIEDRKTRDPVGSQEYKEWCDEVLALEDSLKARRQRPNK